MHLKILIQNATEENYRFYHFQKPNLDKIPRPKQIHQTEKNNTNIHRKQPNTLILHRNGWKAHTWLTHFLLACNVFSRIATRGDFKTLGINWP